MVIVGEDGYPCIACLTAIQEEDKSKIMFFPINSILLLNEDPNSNRIKPHGWKKPKELLGHPILDCPEDMMVIDVNKTKWNSVKRIVNRGIKVPTIRFNNGGTIRIGRHPVNKLGLSQFELDWIETYCKYTFEDFSFICDKLNELVNDKVAQPPKKTTKHTKIKKPKIKAKERRRIERERNIL